MTSRKALGKKVFVLGVDGLDPRYSKKMLAEGRMPNLQKLIDKGSAREDLVLLGGHPTVTPPMWTTLACGCNSNVHGITAFYRQGSDIDKYKYNCDSRKCQAEPMWNVLVENDIKTLVMHWPGNAWPPTSDSENLFVVDGSTPGFPGMLSSLESEFMFAASDKAENTTFLRSATADIDKACVIKLDPQDTSNAPSMSNTERMQYMINGEMNNYIMNDLEGVGAATMDDRLSISVSPFKEPSGWALEVPEGAREFTLLLSEGRLRRMGLLLKNEQGVYDHVELYKSKKAEAPMANLPLGVMVPQIVDEVVDTEGNHKEACYSMKLLRCAEDGTQIQGYVSSATDTHGDFLFSPTNLFYELTENVGFLPGNSGTGNHDAMIVTECMLDQWNLCSKWYSDAIHYMIEKKGVEAIFSHFHSIDAQEHRFIRFMHNEHKGYEQGPEEMYRGFMDNLYIQIDNYIGQFLHLIDEGWAIMLVSDHAQVCPTYKPNLIGDMKVNIGVMRDLGYTVLKKDENGNELREMDWEKTRAVATRECNIYINLKGRDPHGIVDPADKYELEEQIMTDLYGYKDAKTGKRIISIALRNKDAVLLGYGGPECGDICYWVAEGYNVDHADGLSTTYGECETSLSPIFVAAGEGIKSGYTTDRWVRQIDIAPTVAALMGVRMPAQCEGAPMYQIFTNEF